MSARSAAGAIPGLAVALFTSGCTPGQTARSSFSGAVIDGINVACDPAPTPPPAVACDPAVTAALPASGFALTDLDFAEFHFGGYCPPGVPCAPPRENEGYVVVHLKRGDPAVMVSVSADPGGRITVTDTRWYPPTAP